MYKFPVNVDEQGVQQSESSTAGCAIFESLSKVYKTKHCNQITSTLSVLVVFHVCLRVRSVN